MASPQTALVICQLPARLVSQLIAATGSREIGELATTPAELGTELASSTAPATALTVTARVQDRSQLRQKAVAAPLAVRGLHRLGAIVASVAVLVCDFEM